jgi:hypothetical protein
MRVLPILVAIALLSTAALLGLPQAPLPSPVEQARAAPSPLAPVPLELQNCEYVEILVKVLPEDVAPYVPDDFEIRLAIDGTTTLLIGGATCAEATSGALEGPAVFGWTSVRINTPTDPVLRGPEIRPVYLYRLEHMLVPGDVYAAVADQVGAERIELDAIEASSGPALAQLSMRGEGFEHKVLGLGDLPVEPQPCCEVRWREFGSVPAGYAILDAHLSGGGTGGTTAGIILPSPGSAAEDVMGPANFGLLTRGPSFAVLEAYMDVLPNP